MVILYEYKSEKELSPEQDNNNSNHHSDVKETESNTTKSNKFSLTSTVLCPSYKISRSKDGQIECFASFYPNVCNTSVDIHLEVWIKEDRMLQSRSKKIFVDCNPDAEILNR